MSPRVEIGRIWDGFAVEQVLADGADATVYLVQNSKRGTRHALKVLRNLDTRKRIRLEQEAVFHETLLHTNIVAATQVIDVDGEPGLVMEHVDGPTLDLWLRTQAPEDPYDRLRIFRGVLEACVHAHARGVVHRDLKPANILFERRPGGGFRPRIIDFGLARALSAEVGKFGGLTTVNTSLGTAGYAAPEQIRDATTVDHRADLYSIGCLMYELACGTAPFAGLSAFETFQAQKEGRYRPPEQLAPDLAPALHALIRELLDPERDRRPASAEVVLERLDRVLAARPVTPALASDTSAPERVELTPALLLSMVPVIAMIVGAAVVFGG